MSRQPDKSSKCMLKHETEEDHLLVSREAIDRRDEDNNYRNQLTKATATESEDYQNNVEENNQKKKSKNVRRSTLDFKKAYNIAQKMIVEIEENDSNIIKGKIKGKFFEGKMVKYITVDKGRKTNPMLTIHLAARDETVKFLLVGKEKCPLCRPENRMKGDQSQVSRKAVNLGKYKAFCDLMESINFTDCIFNKIKNNTHTHEATINMNLKCLAKLVDQIIVEKEGNIESKPLFVKGEILENINWKFLQGASKITVVVREKGKHGPTLEMNIKKEISFIIKSRIKDHLNVKIHSAIQIKDVNNGASNLPELVTASIGSEEAPDNLVMTGRIQEIVSMSKKNDIDMSSKPEVVMAIISSDPEEMQAMDSSLTKENDQHELVTANSDSEEALDNLVMTVMQGIDKKDDTATGIPSKPRLIMTSIDPKETLDNMMTGELLANSAVTKENNNGIPNQPELVTATSDSEEAPDNLVMAW